MKSSDLSPGIFTKRIKKLKDEIEAEYIEKEPKGTIYHYTDANGLMGIVQNKNLWCTDIEYMNDPDELNYAKELIKMRLDEFGKENEDDSKFFEILENNLYRSYTDVYNINISCFSEEKNIPNQWASYGNYCIGFNCQTPFKTNKHANYASFSSSWQTARLRKIIYSREVQVAIIDKVISSLYKFFKEKLEPRELGYKKEALNASMDLSELIFPFLILFKKESFKYEREWRLIHLVGKDEDSSLGMNESDVKFRSVNDHLIPYVKSGIRIFDKEKEGGIYRKEFENSEMFENFDSYMREAGSFPINYVGIGPVSYLDIAKNSVERVLNKYGFSDAEVNVTNSNLRSGF